MGSLEPIAEQESPQVTFDLVAPPKSRPLSKPHKDHAIQFDIDGNMTPVPPITKAAKRLSKFKTEYEANPSPRNKEKYEEQQRVVDNLSNFSLF